MGVQSLNVSFLQNFRILAEFGSFKRSGDSFDIHSDHEILESDAYICNGNINVAGNEKSVINGVSRSV